MYQTPGVSFITLYGKWPRAPMFKTPASVTATTCQPSAQASGKYWDLAETHQVLTAALQYRGVAPCRPRERPQVYDASGFIFRPRGSESVNLSYEVHELIWGSAEVAGRELTG